MSNPLIGIFYYYKEHLIINMNYQKGVDQITRIITSSPNLNNPGEHRDLWDHYMTKAYPELIQLYEDNHKLLPRGRVGFYTHQNSLRFLVTLDRCIQNKEDEIKRAYHLTEYDIEFSYGALNYKCRNCEAKV